MVFGKQHAVPDLQLWLPAPQVGITVDCNGLEAVDAVNLNQAQLFVGKVRDHLNAVVANGKLAQAELKELTQIAERRRRFGIL